MEFAKRLVVFSLLMGVAAGQAVALLDGAVLFQRGVTAHPGGVPWEDIGVGKIGAVNLRAAKPADTWVPHNKQAADFYRSWAPMSYFINASKLPVEDDSVVMAAHQEEDPMADFMKFLTSMFTAVRHEDFMREVTAMTQKTAKSAKDFKDTGKQRLVKYLNEIKGISEEAMIPLTVEIFKFQADSGAKYADDRTGINQDSIKKMPQDVQEAMQLMLGNFVARSDPRDSYLPNNATRPELCTRADGVLANISLMREGLVKTRSMINATNKMLPMVRGYLDTMQPEVVPRVMYVLTKIMDTEWNACEDMNELTGDFLAEVKGVLRQRLDCKLQSAGSRQGPGGLVGLVLLLLGRWIWAA